MQSTYSTGMHRTIAETYGCNVLQLFESSTDMMRAARDILTCRPSVAVLKSKV